MFFFDNFYDMGVACGPCYTLILHKALATRPVSAPITNAAAAHHRPNIFYTSSRFFSGFP